MLKRCFNLSVRNYSTPKLYICDLFLNSYEFNMIIIRLGAFQVSPNNCAVMYILFLTSKKLLQEMWIKLIL